MQAKSMRISFLIIFLIYVGSTILTISDINLTNGITFFYLFVFLHCLKLFKIFSNNKISYFSLIFNGHGFCVSRWSGIGIEGKERYVAEIWTIYKKNGFLNFCVLAAERISENMHIVANEPSLALYRLQEHVRKALPPMVERRVEVTKLQHELQGRCYDVEYALK